MSNKVRVFFSHDSNNIITNTILSDHAITGYVDAESLSAGTPSIGWTYDSTKKIVYSPKPYSSWTLNTTKAEWVAPVAIPADNAVSKQYLWDESNKNWKAVEELINGEWKEVQ